MPSDTKTISETRSAAARRNGAKSKGPTTPEGKARSSRNALKHGLTAAVAVLPHESEPEFQELHASFLARFEPKDPAELALVEQMISATWRQRRYWQIETTLLHLKIEQNRKWENKNRKGLSEDEHCALGFNRLSEDSLDRLVRYENSLRRQFERALNTLLKLRAAEAKTTKRTQADPPPEAPTESPSPILPPDSCLLPSAVEKQTQATSEPEAPTESSSAIPSPASSCLLSPVVRLSALTTLFGMLISLVLAHFHPMRPLSSEFVWKGPQA